MTGQTYEIEELNGGLQAAFINMPHFRTSSARLTIHSGSLHENQDTAGAAHFLEHITFQGTENLPTENEVFQYCEDNGLNRNASTGHTETYYSADGYDLASVGHFVTQVALHPLLGKEALERERNPIVDEVRFYASNPYFYTNMAHARIVRGQRCARPIGGMMEDVLKITHEGLTDYHTRNYRLANALLVFCSSEPVERQREYAEALIGNVVQPGIDKPTPIGLSRFNPESAVSSLQIVDLPLSAQTSVNIDYEIPGLASLDERLGYALIGNVLSKLVHRRLRSELALCYSAHANIYRQSNLHFGNKDSWSYFAATANLNGKDAVTALSTMLEDVIQQELPASAIESTLRVMKHEVDHILEANPATIANFVRESITNFRSHEVDFDEFNAFADRISVDQLRKLHRNMIDTTPLIISTSPDPAVLEQIGEWSNAKIQI